MGRKKMDGEETVRILAWRQEIVPQKYLQT